MRESLASAAIAQLLPHTAYYIHAQSMKGILERLSSHEPRKPSNCKGSVLTDNGESAPGVESLNKDMESIDVITSTMSLSDAADTLMGGRDDKTLCFNHRMYSIKMDPAISHRNPSAAFVTSEQTPPYQLVPFILQRISISLKPTCIHLKVDKPILEGMTLKSKFLPLSSASKLRNYWKLSLSFCLNPISLLRSPHMIIYNG